MKKITSIIESSGQEITDESMIAISLQRIQNIYNTFSLAPTHANRLVLFRLFYWPSFERSRPAGTLNTLRQSIVIS